MKTKNQNQNAALRESIRYALHKAGVSYRETTSWKLCQLAEARAALEDGGGRAEILEAADEAAGVREWAEALGGEITSSGMADATLALFNINK